MKTNALLDLYLYSNKYFSMFNKKLIFALVLLVMAISSVSAGGLNSTDDAYSFTDNGFEAASQNSSSVLMSESNGEGLAKTIRMF